MIELKKNLLVFTFPKVHMDARLTIEFQQTLRIPDDDKAYPLPPGLGRFPLGHVDDFAERVHDQWIKRGGVMFPMYQSEAMWLNFRTDRIPGPGDRYPFAIKIATGKIDAVTGQEWSNDLHRDPQDYVVAPEQPWLDGYCVEKGIIRQFVAMPLGSGYSAEEQVTGKAEYGGLQIIAYPMKRKVFERRVRKVGQVDQAVHMDFCTTTDRDLVTGLGMAVAPGGRTIPSSGETSPANFPPHRHPPPGPTRTPDSRGSTTTMTRVRPSKVRRS
jgi:hypothetical protein